MAMSPCHRPIVLACDTQIETGSLDLDRQSSVAPGRSPSASEAMDGRERPRRRHSRTMVAPRALSWRPISSRSWSAFGCYRLLAAWHPVCPIADHALTASPGFMLETNASISRSKKPPVDVRYAPEMMPRSCAAPIPRRDPHTVASIPTTILAELARYADTLRVPVEPWLAGLGLTRAQIDDATTCVSYRHASTIIRRALRAIGQGNVGLQVGSRQSLGTFGVLGLAMMTSRTFGEAMAIGIEHHAISGALMDMELEVLGPSEVALLARPRFADDPILAFLCEELFASS